MKEREHHKYLLAATRSGVSSEWPSVCPLNSKSSEEFIEDCKDAPCVGEKDLLLSNCWSIRCDVIASGWPKSVTQHSHKSTWSNINIYLGTINVPFESNCRIFWSLPWDILRSIRRSFQNSSPSLDFFEPVLVGSRTFTERKQKCSIHEWAKHNLTKTLHVYPTNILDLTHQLHSRHMNF